ncbi:MAG TPA: flagellar biosynthesis protein FlgN [Treponemataceae bacterium]|nr:flagellar biosynthesis protein FlgN [Treponemataceae bacterium]
MEHITQKELGERIAVLRRLKKLLQAQRQKFRDYLEVLELQEKSFSSKDMPDTEALIAHSELEQQIVQNIHNLQKVILPLENMCYDTNTEKIPTLKADLSRLQKQVLQQNEKNRTLLKSHINVIRTQINNFKNPYKGNRSVYASSSQTAQHISVEC